MNKKNKSIPVREMFGGLTVLILFVAAGYVSQNYGDNIHTLVGEGGVIGLVSYVLITIIAVVIAPVSTLPLLPIAVTLWGAIPGALLSILGWTIGSIIAYSLSKKYGRMLVERITNLEKAQHIGEIVTGENPFWTIVLLRIVVPVDILSYALGLFIDIRMRSYALATLIGVTPFAFIFAYTATLPLLYQIIVIIIAGIMATLGFIRIRTAVGKVNS